MTMDSINEYLRRAYALRLRAEVTPESLFVCDDCGLVFSEAMYERHDCRKRYLDELSRYADEGCRNDPADFPLDGGPASVYVDSDYNI